MILIVYYSGENYRDKFISENGDMLGKFLKVLYAHNADINGIKVEILKA